MLIDYTNTIINAHNLIIRLNQKRVFFSREVQLLL